MSAETIVYASMAPEQSIRAYRLDTKTGKLTEIETLSVQGSPGSLAVDPSKKFLFASLRSGGSLASFRIDPATGKLSLISTASLGKDANAAFVTTDRTGRYLLSASYAAGTTVVHALDDDGTIKKPALQTVTTAKTAHAAVLSPDNPFVFVPHVAPNAVYQFHFDAAKATLTAAGRAQGGTASGTAASRVSSRPATWPSPRTKSAAASRPTVRRKTGLHPVETLSTLPRRFHRPRTRPPK